MAALLHLPKKDDSKYFKIVLKLGNSDSEELWPPHKDYLN